MQTAQFPEKELFTRHFGRDVYAVGGYVRDLILQRRHREVDLLITRHNVDDILARLGKEGRADPVGRSFGVIKFTINGRTYDIALPRQEAALKTRIRGHKDFIIDADPGIPLEKDLERRDFRCNSIALRLEDGEIIDPFGGQEDIRDKKLRMTNPSAFPEDPLRLIRAARFVGSLGFSLDESLFRIAPTIDLRGLSAERITEELFRILNESPVPSLSLEAMRLLGVIEQLFPELNILVETIQDPVFHPEKNVFGHPTVWIHTLISVDQAARLKNQFDLPHSEGLALVLAVLFHDIGKPLGSRWEFKRGRMTLTNNGHDLDGEEISREIFERLKIFSWNGYDLRKIVLALIRCHHRPSEIWQNRDVVTKKAFNRLAADINGEIQLLILMDAADRAGRNPEPVTGLDEEARWLFDKFEEWNVSKETIRPMIMGRDLIPLGVKPGPGMGRILKNLYQQQLDGEFETHAAGMKAAEQILKEDKK